MFGWILATLVAMGLVAIGVGALFAPRMSCAQYGIVLDDPRALAFVRAMGVRDLALGLVFGLLIHVQARETLVWAIVAITPIALLDFVVVTADRRASVPASRPGFGRAPALHAGGALGLLATAGVLHAGF